MRHIACLGLAAALAAVPGWGCDYGTTPEEGASIESNLLLPGQPLTQGNPGIGVSPDKSSGSTADGSDTADSNPTSAPAVLDRAPSADCIDFTSGMARLVLCNARGALTNPSATTTPTPGARPRPRPPPTDGYRTS
jgi:hypothetical protein